MELVHVVGTLFMVLVIANVATVIWTHHKDPDRRLPVPRAVRATLVGVVATGVATVALAF